MKQNPDDRFGITEEALRAACESHGTNNPTVRLGMYIPTRREVAEAPPEWLYPVLIDWLWECPTELIPSNEQIQDVKTVLLKRSDISNYMVIKLIGECDEFLLT